MSRRHTFTFGSLIAVALAVGCADVKHDQPDGAAGANGAAGAGSPFENDGAAGTGSGQDALGAPPVDFTMTELGGYKRGEALRNNEMTVPETGPKVCNTIKGVVRDFKGALPAYHGALEPGGHPDFEVFEGRGPTRGLVAPDLPVSQKPVYVPKCEKGAPISATTCPFGAMTTSKERFDQWYVSTPGINKPFLVYFLLAPGANGVSTFYSTHFFPMDGEGWGNSGTDMAGKERNFSFTTEIHTTFRYKGGEHFTFQGDDDVWIFINGKLAVDLGGLHLADDTGRGTVDLDASAVALGITVGQLYPLDLFHAERHSVDSNFRIDLNFQFESCGYVVP